MSQETVTIPVEQLRALEARLKELEEREASIPTMIETAVKNVKTEKLKDLRERYKPDPDAHRKRMLEMYYSKKEEINARRRAAYKAKKEAAAASQTS